jgi:hypothetical protein
MNDWRSAAKAGHRSRFTHHVRRITNRFAGLLSFLYLLTPSLAQVPFTLDATTWPEPKAISLLIPDNGLIAFQLLRTNSTAWTNVLEFRLFSFRDVVTGDPLPVKMFLPGQGAPSNAVDHCDFRFLTNQALLELALVVPPTPSTNPYLGSLGIREANGIWAIHKLALRRPGPQKVATLVVDQPALNVALKRTLHGARPKSSPDVSVTLHDDTRTWRIEGITVSPRSVSSPARSTFSFDKNVRFFLNEGAALNLTQSPSDPKDLTQRSIPAGGQAVLGLGFVDLVPGEYIIELKLLALNSKDDDQQQKLTINVKVADSFLPALATLIIALLVSFFTYKWLRFYQQSLGFQRRLAALRPPWLEEQPPLYSVVWVRTVLWQTESLIRKLLLVEPALITERIDKVTPVLDALNEARRARASMRDLPQLVANRFDAVVAGYVRSMSDQNMDKAAAQKAKDALSALNADLAAERIADSYWTEVEKEVLLFFFNKDVDSFRTRLDSAELTPESKAKVETVLSTRNAPPKPADLNAMMDYEQNYMKVKLLYERQERAEFPALIEVFEKNFQKTFDVADKADWDLIKKAKLRVEAPMNDGLSAHEAYEPLRFQVTTGDKLLNETYLFRRGLKFKWHAELRGQSDEKDLVVYEPETLSPRMVHFSVDPGMLSVSAKVLCDTPLGEDEKTVDVATVPIAKSSEFKIFQHLERAEALSLVFAGSFAIISGLLTFYYKNPTFGSFQDYLMLFLWGVGVDQTKNFLQIMQSTKPDSTQ